jgi:hypothetical protein
MLISKEKRMWPFASRGSRQVAAGQVFKDLPPFEAFADDDAVLKVWLTDKLSERIDFLSERRDTSRPDVLRALLFEHLYGRIAYEELIAYGKKKRPVSLPGATVGIPDEIRYSRREETPMDIKFCGKALDDFKLHLPSRLKNDLESIAKIHGLTASSYVRKMLVMQLLGEGIHTQWQDAIGKIPAEIIQMELD